MNKHQQLLKLTIEATKYQTGVRDSDFTRDYKTYKLNTFLKMMSEFDNGTRQALSQSEIIDAYHTVNAYYEGEKRYLDQKGDDAEYASFEHASCLAALKSDLWRERFNV